MSDFYERIRAKQQAEEAQAREEQLRQQQQLEAQRSSYEAEPILRDEYPRIIRDIGVEDLIRDVARAMSSGRVIRVNGNYSSYALDSPRSEDPDSYESPSHLIGYAFVFRDKDLYEAIFAGFSDDSLGVGRGSAFNTSSFGGAKNAENNAIGDAGISEFQTVVTPENYDSTEIENARRDIENILLSLVY